MEIEIHGFVAVLHNIGENDIVRLASDILYIDYRLFTEKRTENYMFLKYAFGSKGESISIRAYSLCENSNYNYAVINLHGSFFDNSPNFKFKEFISFINMFNYTPKQIDIAFNDNNKCLSISDIELWCKRPEEYCVGSLVNKIMPKILYQNDKFYSVQLNSAKSKTNYGTIYVRPDTGFLRLEIKYKNKDKIMHVIDGYCIDNEHFNICCIEALVGCINFVKPTSRGKRGKHKDIKLDSWKSFLESDINKINWNKIKREKKLNRLEADNYSCEKSIKRVASMFNNLVKKSSLLMPEEAVLKRFAEYSGFIVNRNKTDFGAYHKYR